MKVLIFDTETTGKIEKHHKKYKRYDLYPHIVQLSWILYDSNTNKIIRYRDDIVKIPEGKIIPEECIKIHGITNEINKEKGIDLLEAINYFDNAYIDCDILIAHNLEFDMGMIISELERKFMIPIFDLTERKKYCTMKNNTEFCGIITKNNYGEYLKWPSLLELHNKLFKRDPKNLHNALNDVIITLRCFIYQNFNKDLLEDGPRQIKKWLTVLLY